MAKKLDTVEEQTGPVSHALVPKRNTPKATKRPPLVPSSQGNKRVKDGVSSGTPPSVPSIGRLLLNQGSISNRSNGSSHDSQPSSSSEVLTRVGGVIDTRSSSHRPHSLEVRGSGGGASGAPAAGVQGPGGGWAGGLSGTSGPGTLQHDLDLLSLYKQARREEHRHQVAAASPFKFVDDALDEEPAPSLKARDSNPLEKCSLNEETFEGWLEKMDDAVEQRRRNARALLRSPRPVDK